MKFKSKIDWWFYLVVFGFAAITILLICMCFVSDVLGARIIAIVISALFTILFFTMIFPVLISTYYVLEEDFLYVKCGLLCREKINYIGILSVKETRSPSSSAAPSLDRLEIAYQSKYGNIMISPKQKHEFIEELLKRNPNIEFINKK